MTWTREKHVAAILNGMDPRLARAADSLLDAGLIVQVGERLADNGKMLPVYQIIKTAKNKSKWIETLCALPSDVLDAFEESVARDVTTEKDSRKGEAMSENDKRLAVYMYFVSREAMREGVEILNNLGYRYTEHPEHIDEADPNTTFVEAWKPLPADDVVFADEDKVSSAAIHEINHAIGMLGESCEAGIFDADEQAYWWDDEQMK